MFRGINTVIGVILILYFFTISRSPIKFSKAATLANITRVHDPKNYPNLKKIINNIYHNSVENDSKEASLLSSTQLPIVSNKALILAPQNHNRSSRSLLSFNTQETNPECEFTTSSRKPAIYGIRCDTCDINDDDDAIIIRAHYSTKVILIGRNLYSNISVALTASDGNPQDDCTHNDRIKSFQLINNSSNVAEINVELASPGQKIPYYFCIRVESTERIGWFHQGSDPWLKLYVKEDYLPLYGKLIVVALLLSLSGTFSGLNLGLMSLDKNDLQVIMKCGSDDEKRYAKIIDPVRARGNYLLCSILFSNTLVNSTISVLLEDLSDGLIAIITSTVLIVLFGEILPQAFCSRHGLAVGAKTVYLTHFCMFITFPLSWPVSTLLDLVLGEEIGQSYDRERLMEFIKLTQDYNKLEADEVNIISGALKIKRVQIREIMTKIEDVYMLDETEVLDYATIQAIVEKGYSRIPIHESGNRNNIIAVLFAKDLALVDPDDKTPIQSMVSFYNHPRMFVFEDTTLDTALNEFKSGKSHMAIVQKVINDGDRDPFYEITGVVTLEDVIEEIMQMEINDETDTLSDNRRKRRRKDAQVRKDFSDFTNLGSGDSSYNVVTPQLCLAAYQFLATTVEPFTAKYLSDTVLKRLLSQKIFYRVKLDDDPKMRRLYTAGQPADYFIMILEGRVHVTCGRENLFFDGGPFCFFGKAALLDPTAEPVIDILATPDSPSTNAMIDTAPLSNQQQHQRIPSVSDQSRRESLALKTGRRESISKAITGHLSLSMKKLSEQVAQVEPTEGSNIAMNFLHSSDLTSTSTVAMAGKVSNFIVPDYTVDVIANTSYLKVTTNDYVTSLRATALERSSAIGELEIEIDNHNC